MEQTPLNGDFCVYKSSYLWLILRKDNYCSGYHCSCYCICY